VDTSVYIVDAVQTQHCEKNTETVQEMAFGLVKRLLDRNGIERSEIGTMVSSSSDYWQGISCSNSYYYDSAGANLKSGSKAAEDSALGFHYGVMRILSGQYKTALVVSLNKCSEAPSMHTLSNIGTDPFFQRSIGLNETIVGALQARMYMDRFGLSENDLAQVVKKNMANAQKNPNSHRGGTYSDDDLLSFPIMASPLREIDVPNTSDGGCAVLLAAEAIAKELTQTPIRVQGLGWCVNSTFLGDQNLLEGTLGKAAKMAYRSANIKNPFSEIDLAEICETTSFHEILWTEQLGFFAAGKGGKFLQDGVTSMDGDLYE
jgi:acetyl-CoA C-acetyltransferase